jgi:hypothetical protein
VASSGRHVIWVGRFVSLPTFLISGAFVVACTGGASPAGVQARPEKIQHIGEFSDLRETDGHVYGHTLQLWRDGARVIGLLSKADGQPADFPTVLISDLDWNEQTGAVRFTIRWCSSVEGFRGELKDGILSGRLSDLQNRGDVTELRLKRHEDDWPSLAREEWQSRIDRILKARRPGC